MANCCICTRTAAISAATARTLELHFRRPVDTFDHVRPGDPGHVRSFRSRDLRAEPAISRPIPTTADFNSNRCSARSCVKAQLIGAIALGRSRAGGFSDSQIELLKTFAEQAVIAISSAETYRALQTRTGDLQESLEYQTATSDVLKVISRSTFDLQPVLAMVAETAARLCAADQAVLIRHENGIIEMVANFGFPPEYVALLKELGTASTCCGRADGRIQGNHRTPRGAYSRCGRRFGLCR